MSMEKVLIPTELVVPPKRTQQAGQGMHGSLFVSGGDLILVSGATLVRFSGAQLIS